MNTRVTSRAGGRDGWMAKEEEEEEEGKMINEKDRGTGEKGDSTRSLARNE